MDAGIVAVATRGACRSVSEQSGFGWSVTDAGKTPPPQRCLGYTEIFQLSGTQQLHFSGLLNPMPGPFLNGPNTDLEPAFYLSSVEGMTT